MRPKPLVPRRSASRAVSRRCLLTLAGLTLLAPRASHAGAERVVALQPLGGRDDGREASVVRAALAAFFDAEIVGLPARALPASTYYAPRRRWRAEKLLDHLVEVKPPRATRIVGLTAADISTTKGTVKDWGILGLATLDGTACVLSSFRARRGARGEAHALARLGKVAVHELGHTVGLPHCPNAGCLMEDARGKVATTDGETDLCSECRAKLSRTGWGRTDAVSPWA